MREGSILKFAESFINKLGKLREHLENNGYKPKHDGSNYETFGKRLKKKYNIDLEDEIELDLGVLKDSVIDNLFKRKELKEAQKYAFESVSKITKSNGDTRTIEGLDKVMFFNLPTGSGKTLIYTLIGYYYILRGLLEKGKAPKFVIATRTNLEGGQVLSTIYSVKLALKLFDVVLNDPIRIDDKPVKRDVIDKIIITNYWGASNVPCIAKARDTGYTHAVSSRKKCSRYRNERKCPYVDEIQKTKLYNVLSLGSDEEPREVVKELLKNMCPLYSTALASALAHFVVTNHATISRIASGIQGAPIFVLISQETYVGNEIDDLVSFLTSGLGEQKVRRAYQDNLRRRIEEHLPYDTVLVIDEADNFLGGIHKVEEKSVSFPLPLSKVYKDYSNPNKTNVVECSSRIFTELYKKEKLLKNIVGILKNNINEDRIGEFLKKVKIDEKEERKRGSKVKKDDTFSPKVFNALFHLRVTALLDRNVSLSPGLSRLLIPKIIRMKSRKSGYNGDSMEVAIFGTTDAEFIKYVAHYIFAPYDSPNNYDLLIKVLNELESLNSENEEIVRNAEKLERVAKDQILEGDRYYKAANLINNVQSPDITEDDALYVKINMRSSRVSVSLVRYQDVIEALENLLRRRLMFFSATNDFLYIYTLMVPLRELRLKLEDDNPRSYRSIIIYNGERKKTFDVMVYYENISKDKLERVFPQALKEFGIGSKIPRPFMLVLVPANDDISKVEKAMKQIYSHRGVRIINLASNRDLDENLLRTVEDIIKKMRSAIKEAEESNKDSVYLKRLKSRYSKDIETAEKGIEAIRKDIHKEFYDSFIKPMLEKRNGKIIERLNAQGYPKDRIEFLSRIYSIVHEATLIKYVLEEHKRFVSRGHLQRSVKENIPFVAVGTGAFSRGFDFPRLNSVVVARLTFIPPDLQTKNDIRRMRRTESRQTKQIVEEVLDDRIKTSISYLTGKNKKKEGRKEEESTENYLERYASVSYAAISGIQAMGRLTRGEGKKIAFIADGRFKKKRTNVLGALDVLAEVNKKMIKRMRREGVKIFMYTRDNNIVDEYSDYDLRHVLKITRVMDRRKRRRSLLFLNV